MLARHHKFRLLWTLMVGLMAVPRAAAADGQNAVGTATIKPVARRRDSGQPPKESAASHSRGIDVSIYQKKINWPAVKGSGVTFAIAKATEGIHYVDKNFDENLAGMKKVGILPGAYHYARPGKDAADQADHFTKIVKAANGGSYSGLLQLMLDLEETDKCSPEQVWAWTQKFTARVRDKTGRPCLIYTGYYFWRNKVGDPKNNLDCPLWLAAYVPESETGKLIPQAWSKLGWAFWQHTSKGNVPGIEGRVDLDYFQNGGSYPDITSLKIP